MLTEVIYGAPIGRHLYRSIFIPASRSFFANLQKNIFGFLASNIAIDPLIKEFGAAYENSIFEIGDPRYCAIYLELKGADIDKAFSQLIATLRHVRPRHETNAVICHIVASPVPRAGTKVQNLKILMVREHNIQLFVGTREVSINIESSPYNELELRTTQRHG